MGDGLPHYPKQIIDERNVDSQEKGVEKKDIFIFHPLSLSSK